MVGFRGPTPGFQLFQLFELSGAPQTIEIIEISAGEDPKQYGRKDRRDRCYSTIFVLVSCRLGKIKPRKISCCCCRFEMLLFFFCPVSLCTL